jgi:hypothetical protein
MEKYSKHLEAIVAERTQDLLQEKQKTDCLLYSKYMKPQMVHDMASYTIYTKVCGHPFKLVYSAILDTPVAERVYRIEHTAMKSP